jgi:hypothetical protein
MNQINPMQKLVRHYQASIQNSESAIRDYPHEFSEIRKIVDRIIMEPVDIDDYYPLAKRLAGLLETMGPETIFSNYFLENIHPDRGCRARYLRFICKDLKQQMSHLLQRRKNQRHLRLL